ncbi:hypothetical protein SJAG_16459 [Schizosaccharomyces japonicus yFS275]|uniref:Vacuolar protein sorting-associated protein n=1 Tax=Schizosaccharomyces japonicus (strain yFS275 / FY16936) TaxID=402676 RepID=T0TAZ1_SCHJY|nr:hypothetical protein SJAG_16459 [Schizosaccharomyces japonicus yFS275]EQC52983.1 hypothetical protein SJAG_16459 [Schizosaccharomyces japonicus yFS275]
MLEGLLASFLNRFLGEYIEDFDAKQLNVGVWNGSITLRDLTLKPNALRRFGLPIGVQYGIVRKLDVTIPWSNLRNKPVEIHISGIQALGSSNTTIAKREPELEDSNVLLEHKRNELEYWEASRLSSNSEQNDPKAQSMTESLLTRMVNNIQVTIEDIHIRYENDGARAKLPKGFAFGICISQFSVVSCNDNWVPIFIEQDLNIIHKLCSLESFCIYYNEFSVNSNTHVDDYSVYLNETKTNGIEYIVSPVNGTARLVLNKDPTSEAPKTTVDLIFDALNLTLYDQQYSELLETWNDVSLFLIARKHAAERPQQSYSDNPTVWLRYAFLHELRLVRQRRKAATWPAIKAFCERRRSYLELFEKRFLESLTPEESAAIDELELFFSVSDIKLFRTLVYQKIKREGIKPKPKPAETQQGWTSWLWNSLKSDTATEEIDLAEKQRIVDAIGFDEQTIRETDNEESSSRAKCKVKIALKAGKFSLFERVNDVDILSVRFVNLESQHEYTPLAYEGDIQLGDLLVLNDKRKLLFLRDQKAANSIEPQPLLKMNMSVAFNDSSPTDSLSMGLQALEFYYDYATAAQVQKFFSQPSETQKQVRAFMKYAGNAVNGITTQTTQALRRYLQDRRKFILDLNLHAPVIYLPETEGSQVTNLLCIDAGKLTINSSTPNYAQEEQEDPNELPTELFYECYKLSVENAQLLLGPSDILKTSDVNLKKKYALIENITTHFNVKALSVFSKDLPRYVFEGELEKLNLFMSDSQYRSLMRIQDCMTASTEHFEDASSVTDDDQSSSFYFQPEDDDRDFEQGPLLELSFQASALSLVLQKEIQDKSFIPMIEINVGTGRMSLKKTDEQMFFQLLVQRIGILDRATETVGQGTPKILDCSGTSEENEWPIEFTANFQHGVDNGNQNVNTYTFSCERGVLKLAKLPLFSMAEYFAVFSTDDDETKETIINDSDIQSITNLNTHFKSISFSIMDDYMSAPVEFNLSDAKMQFNSKTGSMGVILHLQDMNVVSHKKGLTDHLSLLKTNGDSLVDLTCEYRFASAANSYVPTCDFTLQSGTCSVLYDEESIKRLLLIFSDIIQTKAVIDSARYLAANGSYQVEQGTIFNLSLDVEKPVMLLPVPLRDDCNAILELSPGNLSIKTSSWLPSLSLELVFDSMSAHTYVDVNNQVTNHQTVLNDLNFRVQLKVDQYDQGKKNFYRISVLSNLNKFCVSVSEFQYVILLKFLSTSTQFLTLFDSFRSNIDAESLSKALYNETYNPETLKNTIEHLTLSTSIEVFFSFLADSIGIKLFRGGFKPNDLTPLTDITFDNVSLKSLYEDTKGTDAFLSLSSIRIQDIRDPTSELADIVLIEEESSSHFDARFSLENGSHVGVLSASLEKTRYILSLDYFIALYKYLQIPPEYSSANDGNPEIVNTSRKTPAENPKQDGLTMHYNFDILDTNVLLLSDISDKNSQVLLLNVEHTTLIKQNSYSVIVKNIGLSMSQLNNLKSDGITLVDDFSLCFGMEIGSTTNGSLDIDPLTLRLSVYDIVLLKRLFYSATELLQQNGIISSSDVKELEEEKLKEVLTHGTEASSFSGLRARSEELTFTSGGSQLLLISDSHNLPIASFSVDPFNLSLKNWSTSPRFKVLLGFDCRVFNFAKSHWEPFLEHWNILLTLRKNDGDFVLNAVSDDVAEVSVTSKLLESVRYVKKFYEENKNKSVIKRSEGYPYEILNLTGFDVELSRSTDGEDKVVVQNGKSIPWRFEKHKREQGSTKLDEKESDVRLTISFKEVWFPVREVSVHREGTFLFELKPQLETETFLMVNVQLLENSVKRITISSPYIIRNHTSTPFELVFHSSKGHKRSDIYTIEANSYLALPLDLANVYQFRLRPSANRGYVWCHKPVNWMEFLETPLSMFTYRSRNRVHLQILMWPTEPSRLFFQIIKLNNSVYLVYLLKNVLASFVSRNRYLFHPAFCSRITLAVLFEFESLLIRIFGYAWDYPIVKKKRLRFSLDRDFIDVDLSAIGDLTTWKLPNDNLRFRVEMHGITPTLLITNRKPLNTQVPAFDERSRKSRPGEEHTSVTNKSSNGNSFALSVKLFGVGISLINPYYEELAYFTLRDFSLLISSSVNVCDTVVSLGWLQVDNQMNGARFPVILAPKPVTVPDNGESSDFLNLQLSILKSPSYGVTYIRHAGIYMRECTLSLEEAFLAAFSRFLAASPANNSTAIDTGSFETSLPSQNFNDTVEPSNLFIEVLDFCTFKLSVSFATASNEEDNYIGSSKTTSEVLITLFSRFLGNISNAPLVLNAMELQNARVSAGELGNRVQTYYKQQMVSKFPKMLGYSDAFGNPLGLFNTFASTISDADTLYNGDRVVRKAVSGFTDSVSKWTGNLSKNISVYTQKKSDKRSQRKVNLDDVQAPRKDVTPSRFFKRLGGNIVNLGSKPVVGFLDLASNAFGAVRDTAKLDDGEVRPVRYTRYIDYLGLVKSYSRRDAYGQHLLRVCERGAYASDHYLYHAVLPRKELLFFTLEHVLLLDPGSWTFHVICRINEIRRDVVKPGMIEVVCRNEIIKRVPLPTTEQEAGNCVVALHTAIKECQRMRARPPVL